MRATAFALLALGLVATARADGPASLDALLACRDRAALDVAAGVLEARLAADPSWRCKSLVLRVGSAVECDADRAIMVLGLPTREIGAASDRDGTRRMRSVFRASPERLREAATARLPIRFEPDGEDRWIARFADDPRRRVEVSRREDGSSVMVCALEAPRDEASDLALGIDGTRGGIAGRLSFPGGRAPPMRVCAVPVDAALRARCAAVDAGRSDYLLTGLAPGAYHVVSIALADNPNRLVGAYARGLEDCAPNQAGCAGGLLLTVDVRAGSVVTDVDPDRWFTDLPARFDEVRSPAQE